MNKQKGIIKSGKTYITIGIKHSIENIDEKTKSAIELNHQKPPRINPNRHYRDITKTAKTPIRTIEEYIKAKKRFSLDNFNALDVKMIMTTDKGFIKINNCNIPIKNKALDLTQWISKNTNTIIHLTKDEKKLSAINSQKRYREKQKLIKSGAITIEDKPLESITYANSQNIFYGNMTTKTRTSKRIITAIRNTQSFYIPEMFFEEYARRPLVKNIFINSHEVQTTEKKKNIYQETFKDFLLRSNRENKKYKALDLFLIDVGGQKWVYGDKGLTPV